MKSVLAQSPSARVDLRKRISDALRRDGAAKRSVRDALAPLSSITLGLPCDIGDYTDFYIGIHHATRIGKLFRPDNPLLPNYKWVPIGYHGRASSINASPGIVRRPIGQRRGADDSRPDFGPTMRLDYELEIGLVIGRPSVQGDRVAVADAESHLFGIALFNDWSARDIQAWEYQPLGPFLAKNFASTLSPWMVTMEALAPFRVPFTRPEGDPQPLPYLDSPENRARGAIDVGLEVWIQTAAMAASGYPGDLLSRSSFTDGYWTAAQLVTHHSVNGCNLRSGDLFGSGTLSGAAENEGGSLLELSQGGTQAVPLSNGESRKFVEDGDTIIFRGACRREGFRRIGFGECRATVVPAGAWNTTDSRHSNPK